MDDDELLALYKNLEATEVQQAATISSARGVRRIARGQTATGNARIARAKEYLVDDSENNPE